MLHKHGYEALDRTLQDLLLTGSVTHSNLPFGGKVVVFGGDFRQILPVIPNAPRQDIVGAALCSSYLWSKCKVLRLTKNMRLKRGGTPEHIEETKRFAQWLLDIGEGKIGGPNDGEAIIEIPSDFLLPATSDPLKTLIEFVYPSILQRFCEQNYFKDRALLAPTNQVVDEINNQLLDMFPGEVIEYLSSDSISQEEHTDNIDQTLLSPDHLNGLKASGLPNHKLRLKVGVPVMLLRNIDQKNGLCNGTRLQVKALGNRVIEAEIISGSNIGYRAFIPRLSLTPSDKRIAIRFNRRQFPLVVSFAMSINKSQGQSLATVGLYLPNAVFSHGQLYVALSRVTTRDGLRILILDNDGKSTNRTTNVVYKEIFTKL